MSSALLVCLVVVLGATIAAGVSTGPRVQPVYQYVRGGSSTTTTTVCSFGTALANCRVRLWEDFYNLGTELDLGRGSESPRVAVSGRYVPLEAGYAGSGLANGDCGVELGGVREGRYLVLCRAQNQAGAWSQGFGLVGAYTYEVLASSTPSQRFVLAVPGADVSVLLAAGGALSECNILTPAAGWLYLTPGQAIPSDSRYRLHGTGPLSGHCGYTLPNVTAADAGVWTLWGWQGNSRARQLFVVAVAAPPVGEPRLEIANNLTLRAGETMTATCWTSPSVPPANITWLLGGKAIRADAWNATLDVDTVNATFPWQPQAARQTIAHVLASGDDGMRLECQVSHVALTGPRTSGQQLQLEPVPAVTPEKAVVTTEKAVVATEKAVVTTEKAVVATEKAVVTAEKAVVTTEKAVVTTEKAVVATEKAVVATEKAVVTAEKAVVATEKAVVTTEKAVVTAEKAVVTTEKAVVTAEKAVVHTAEGFPTELACLVTGHDSENSVTVQWTRGGAPIEASPLVTEGHEGARHWLRLDDPEKDDLATYTCTALIGRQSVSQSVLVTGAPGQPKWVGQGVTSQVAWTVESYVDLTETTVKIFPGKGRWKKVESRTTRLNDSTLLVSHVLQPGATGHHKAYLAVKNTYGKSKTSEIHTFHAGTAVLRPVAESGLLTTPAPLTLECGMVNGIQPRIAGGENAAEGQFPWHAGIYKHRGSGYLQDCGGSLVSARIVISAAHCFPNHDGVTLSDARLYRVVLGSMNRAWNDGPVQPSEQRFEVTSVVLPEHYSGRRGNFRHDIAVVRLARDARITYSVGMICLDWNYAYLQMDCNATVAGWGLTGQGEFSDVLQWVELPFVPKATCLEHLRITGTQHLYTPDKFCAGSVDQSTSVCSGDSGGGLVVHNSTTGQHFLVGVVSVAFTPAYSKGIGCFSEVYAGFTAVSKHAEWLQGVLAD